MKLRALIFDVDGTLAETERDGHRPAFNQAFERAGLDWQWDVQTYGELLKITGGKERIRYFIEKYGVDTDTLPEAPEQLIPKLHQIKTECFCGMVEQGQMPFKTGVRRLFEVAKQADLKLAIATTTTMENVTALIASNLGPSGLELFDVIGAGDVVAKKKPAPDIYQYVLEKLDLAAESCLAFEDSRNGLISARGANLSTVVTPSFYTQTEDFTGSCLVLDSFGDKAHSVTVLAGQKNNKKVLDLEWMQSLLGTI